MVDYDEDLPFCRQCQADLIGAPGEELCGTCGLPARDPGQPGVLLTAARPVPALTVGEPRPPRVETNAPRPGRRR